MSTNEDFAPPIDTFESEGFVAGLAGVLFADDFDLPPPPSKPAPAPPAAPPPPPRLTPEDLAAARAAGFATGHAAARAERAHATEAATQHACAALAAACAAAPHAAQRATAEAAAAAARALLQALASVLPELCAEHGPHEAASLAASLLPSLAQISDATAFTIGIGANAATLAAIRDVVARQGSAVRDAVRLETIDRMAPGDLALHWPEGAATRSTAQLLRTLADGLAPLGIVVPQLPPPQVAHEKTSSKPTSVEQLPVEQPHADQALAEARPAAPILADPPSRAQHTTRELVDV